MQCPSTDPAFLLDAQPPPFPSRNMHIQNQQGPSVVRHGWTVAISVLAMLIVAPGVAGRGVHQVRAGDDLQVAIDRAQPGDVIRLQAGATFTGTFVLRNRTAAGDQPITIRTDADDSQLPSATDRITPQHASRLPTITPDGAGPAIRTDPGARHWRLMGLRIVGKGGHGAAPHETVDPVLASASFVTALQSIVSRNVDPREMAVLTVGSIHGGTASNVIPESVELQITARAFSPAVRDRLEERLPALAEAQAESFGAKAEVAYSRGFPPVINHTPETVFARDVAKRYFAAGQIAEAFQPRTASEDFAFMLQERPGSYLFVGNGDSAPLHSPHYDFNDAIIAPAARFWVRLAEAYLS